MSERPTISRESGAARVSVQVLGDAFRQAVRGPKHADDPPVKLMTTVPESVSELLDSLKQRLGRPRSEIIADAVRDGSLVAAVEAEVGDLA